MPITWERALSAAETLLNQIERSRWTPDVVIGIGRSGGIWGGWFAGNLGVGDDGPLRFAVVDREFTRVGNTLDISYPGGEDAFRSIGGILQEISKPKVLIVEGGATTELGYSTFVRDFGRDTDGWDLKYATVFLNQTALISPDFVGEKLTDWPGFFPWHVRPGYRTYMAMEGATAADRGEVR